MIRWIPYPFARIALFFMAGVLTGIYLRHSIWWLSLSTCFFVLAGCFFVYGLFVLRRYKVAGVFGLIAVFLCGFTNVLVSDHLRREDHIQYVEDEIEYYQVMVSSYPQEKERYWKCTGDVVSVKTKGDDWHKRTGKVQLHFSKADSVQPYQYGDLLIIKGNPFGIRPASNPHAFDYGKFLSYQNIYHQHFIGLDEARVIKSGGGNALMLVASKARKWSLEKLAQYIDGERERWVAAALVLGVTEGLDNELKGAYAAAGTMHVLAVSGLHVGIIYGILLLIFKPFRSSVKGKWSIALVSVIVLWMYAMITGLSPSVLRAVTMFSCVAIANPLHQRTNIYNTLAISICILLLFDPYLIMSVGFQLSYMAVFGIVYLSPRLLGLWEPQSWLWTNVWQIIVVSLAAQLATFPLSLLYFNQFPSYFLLSNLLVIPGAFLVLVTGLLLLLFSFVDVVAYAIGATLEVIVKGLNAVVVFVEQLPFSVVDNIVITPMQCLTIVAALSFFVVAIVNRKFSCFVAAFIFVMGFSIQQWSHYLFEVKAERLVVYNIRNASVFDLFTGGKVFDFSDRQFEEEDLKFNLMPSRLFNGDVAAIAKGHSQPFVCGGNGLLVVFCKGARIAHVTSKNFFVPRSLQVDFVIVSNNALKDLKSILHLGARRIILDSSNTRSFVERILKQATELNVEVRSVMYDGAQEIRL